MTEEILLEDTRIFPTFSEYRLIVENFKNFLPDHEEAKKAHAHEVFGILQKAYEDQGGIHGDGFNSPDDMVKNIPMWKVSKKDGKVNAVGMYKDGSGGRKRVAMGTDGTPEGKKAATDMVKADLKLNRAFMEVSGKSLSFLKKQTNLHDYIHSFDSASAYHKSRGNEISKPAEDDPEVKRHPEFKDHFYVRNIGGHPHTKLMLGTMGNKIS